MIQHKFARFAFYLFLCLMFLVDAFSLFRGLLHPEMMAFGLENSSSWSIQASQSRWVVYHAWCMIILVLLGWAELKSKRGLFLLLMFLSMILFYYPFIAR